MICERQITVLRGYLSHNELMFDVLVIQQKFFVMYIFEGTGCAVLYLVHGEECAHVPAVVNVLSSQAIWKTYFHHGVRVLEVKELRS